MSVILTIWRKIKVVAKYNAYNSSLVHTGNCSWKQQINLVQVGLNGHQRQPTKKIYMVISSFEHRIKKIHILSIISNLVLLVLFFHICLKSIKKTNTKRCKMVYAVSEKLCSPQQVNLQQISEKVDVFNWVSNKTSIFLDFTHLQKMQAHSPHAHLGL